MNLLSVHSLVIHSLVLVKAAFSAATGGGLGGFVADTVMSKTGIGGVAGGALKTALGGFF